MVLQVLVYLCKRKKMNKTELSTKAADLVASPGNQLQTAAPAAGDVYIQASAAGLYSTCCADRIKRFGLCRNIPAVKSLDTQRNVLVFAMKIPSD